jgi:hypothetical protein
MNLTGQVAWEVLPGENSELEEGQLNLGVRWLSLAYHWKFNCCSTIGYSQYSEYPSSGFFSFLAVT